MLLRITFLMAFVVCWSTAAGVGSSKHSVLLAMPTSVPSIAQDSIVNEELRAQFESIKQWHYEQAKMQHVIRFPSEESIMHPLLWCGLNLALISAAVAWASSEWEWEMLMTSIKQKFRLPEPETDCKAD